MADSYSRDFFLDSAIEVKQEPSMDGTNFTQSVPIPGRRPQDISDNRDMELFSNFELEICSPGAYQSMGQFSPPVMYNEFNLDVDSNSKFEPFKMDDDDIFQVDKNDLIQGPTLAELNANDDTLLRDLNFDDLVLPEENYSLFIGSSMLNSRTTTPQFHVYPPSAPLPSPASYGLHHRVVTPCSPLESYPRSHGAFSPGSGHSSQPSSLHSSQHGSPGAGVGTGSPHLGLLQQELMGHSRSQHGSPGPGLHELLTAAQAPAVSAPTRQHIAAARLSTSAPTHLSLEQIWQRREPRKHLLSTGSLVEAGSTSSLSTGGILSPGAQEDLSQDEDSDEDSDRYEDYSSDDSDAEYGPEGKSRRSLMAKKERFFWQYNVQAKGPKGQRLVMKTKLEDPHVLNEVTDPVFSPSCSVRGIKHSGKARKGDGNDLTPNPRKLYVIGKELDSLGRVINDMTPVSELPFNVRPKTRKEKNKLASRACRLKKKAQHEANKLKLYGLENEHRRLINGISHLKQLISKKLTQPPADPEEHNAHIEKIMKSATKVKIAGQSSEFVNRVLDKVKSGVPGGGLEEF